MQIQQYLDENPLPALPFKRSLPLMWTAGQRHTPLGVTCPSDGRTPQGNYRDYRLLIAYQRHIERLPRGEYVRTAQAFSPFTFIRNGVPTVTF